jgi:retron-type reverse transcriptase
MGITTNTTNKKVYIPKAHGKFIPLACAPGAPCAPGSPPSGLWPIGHRQGWAKANQGGIPAFYDRIVQEAVRTILQIIYEPIFSNHSHGFRPGRNCHSALRHIRKGSKGFSWAIKGDIKGFFDTIDHSVLLNILNKKIKDPRFISIINALLKVKVQEEGLYSYKNHNSEFCRKNSEFGRNNSDFCRKNSDFCRNNTSKSKRKSTRKSTSTRASGELRTQAQGSIISPLLSNIFLHEFDLFMEDYINEFNKGNARKTNPEYKHRRAYRKYGAKAASKVGYSDFRDKNYRRMNYVRYVDEFLITIIGTKREALAIKQKCTAFLSQLNLTFSDEKTLMTNPKDRPVSFLGYVIQNAPSKVSVYYKKYNGVLRCVLGKLPGGIYLKADSTQVTQRLHEKGFCQKSGHPIANFKYLNNTQHATILQMVYILRGLANYYKLANNSRQMISH